MVLLDSSIALLLFMTRAVWRVTVEISPITLIDSRRGLLKQAGRHLPSRFFSTPKRSLQHKDILLCAHLPQNLRPHCDANLSEMRFAQEKHQGARLADAAAD